MHRFVYRRKAGVFYGLGRNDHGPIVMIGVHQIVLN